MKKRTKIIFCIFGILFAVIFCSVIISSASHIKDTVKENKVLFSSMPQKKSFSFCSRIAATEMSDWGIRDFESVGEKTIDAELHHSYWKIKNTKSIYLHADQSGYNWGLLTTEPSELPSLYESKVSQIEIADAKGYYNFHFNETFTWQDIQTYNLNLDEDSKQEFAGIIYDYLYYTKQSSEKISFDEAKEYRQFYIRFYFENFDEIFYSPSKFYIANYNGNWIVLMDDDTTFCQYAVIDIPEKMLEKLNQIELLPAKDYNATWWG